MFCQSKSFEFFADRLLDNIFQRINGMATELYFSGQRQERYTAAMRMMAVH
jgi:hypothetical protein